MRGLLALLLSTVALTVSTVDSQAPAIIPPPQARTQDYPKTGVQLGQGWNSNHGSKTFSTCIEFTKASDESQAKTAEIRSITDRQSLYDRLEVSAELQYKAIVASVSTKVNFVRSTKLEGEFIHYSLFARVQNGATYTAPINSVGSVAPIMAPFSIENAPPNVGEFRGDAGSSVRLAPRYVALAKNNPEQFQSECGTEFVAAVFAGAELASTLSFRRSSKEAEQQLNVSIEGSGWGITAKGSVGQTLKEFAERKELQIKYFEAGGAGDSIPTDQDTLLGKIAELPKLAQQAAEPFQISLQSYRSLPNWPAGAVIFQDSYSGRAKLARLHSNLSMLRDDLQLVVDNPSQYVLDRGTSLAEAKSLQDRVTNVLRGLEALAVSCESKPEPACEPPAEFVVDGQTVTSFRDDYEVRVRMPVRRGSFAEDALVPKKASELAALKSELGTKQAELAAIVQRLKGGNSISVQIQLAVRKAQLDQEIPAVQAKVNTKQAELDQVKAAWPVTLKQTILESWIRRPSRVRCGIRNSREYGCLTKCGA